MSPRKHLDGLKILDFSAVFAGPICARLLSDCGAAVIKVEAPEGGDMTRGLDGYSQVFAHFNAGKHSIAIDLKKSSGQQLARQLIAGSDVVIENFRPGIMAKFGLDYDSVKADSPELIYCSISGFGQSGPYVNRAAYAPIVHAASGFDHSHTLSQGNSDERPPNWGIMVADMLTGSYAFGAIQTALLGRERTGLGEYIDVSMMESMMTLIPAQIQRAQMEDPPTAAIFHPIKVKDGYVMICIVSEKNMRGLCAAMDRPDLLQDARFVIGTRMDYMSEFVAEIESWSGLLSARECEIQLNKTGVPCSVYNRAEDLFTHPQVLDRGSFKQLDDELGSYFIQNAPFQFRSFDVSTSSHAPRLGEQTHEVLCEVLKLTDGEIDQLYQQGVIA